MSEFHVKKITLPSGKVVELVYLQAPVETDPVADHAGEHDSVAAEAAVDGRRIELCPGCESDRVHPVDWHEVDEGRWRLDLRCPDCRWLGTDVFGQDEVERYDDVLNADTDEMIDELDRLTRRNMADHLERFVRALEGDG